MGARRAAACLCTARVLREAVAAGTWRAPECAGGPLWDPGADLWWGPGALEGRAYGGVLEARWSDGAAVAATLCTGLPFPCCALTKYERF